MEVKIQSIKFDATEKLQEYIQKKVGKLDKKIDTITSIEVSLKVIKPESADNKQADIKVFVPQSELFATKTSDTFEQSVDEALDAIERQLEKYKEKKSIK
ncbi:MAG: ribosome-associated translation inhibitor RaiA [Paludibacteraceae bacterium]|nr:ribosome-associated translation inhibitor RaiA [Paludibacteraceae bacterium]MBP6284077.1 ribosome-associated translation inhibitor RaiA [Paludibacteraceae bacterium]